MREASLASQIAIFSMIATYGVVIMLMLLILIQDHIRAAWRHFKRLVARLVRDAAGIFLVGGEATPGNNDRASSPRPQWRGRDGGHRHWSDKSIRNGHEIAPRQGRQRFHRANSSSS